MIQDQEFGPYGPGDTEKTAKARKWIVETLANSGPMPIRELEKKAHDDVGYENGDAYGSLYGEIIIEQLWILIGNKKLTFLFDDNKFAALESVS